MLHDQFTDPEPLVEFTHQDQASVRRNVRTLLARISHRCFDGRGSGPFSTVGRPAGVSHPKKQRPFLGDPGLEIPATAGQDRLRKNGEQQTNS